MKKNWSTLAWVLIVAVQTAVGYGLVSLSGSFTIKSHINTTAQFLMVPLGIWLGYSIGVYGIGMLGLVLKKVKPLVPGLRLLTTAVMTAIPLLILTFNAITVGLENQQQFQGVVIGRMVPYYTQLCLAFSLLGFYVTLWLNKTVPIKAKA